MKDSETGEAAEGTDVGNVVGRGIEFLEVEEGFERREVVDAVVIDVEGEEGFEGSDGLEVEESVFGETELSDGGEFPNFEVLYVVKLFQAKVAEHEAFYLFDSVF